MEMRIVMQFDKGQATFRRFDPTATHDKLLDLAEAINTLQADPMRRMLLVTVDKF